MFICKRLTCKTLKAYGIPESSYSTEEEMFDLFHEMRKRVFTSKSFKNDTIFFSFHK